MPRRCLSVHQEPRISLRFFPCPGERVLRRLYRRSGKVGAVWWGGKTESTRAFLFGSLKGGLADPPLRASNEGLPSFQARSSRGWNGCAARTKNFFRGSPTRLARRVSRRLRRRSEEAEAVRGRRKAETDRVFLFVHFRGGLVGSRLRASSDHRFIVGALRATGTYQATPSSFAAPATSPPS